MVEETLFGEEFTIVLIYVTVSIDLRKENTEKYPELDYIKNRTNSGRGITAFGTQARTVRSRALLWAGQAEPREATPVPVAHEGVRLRFKERARCAWAVDVVFTARPLHVSLVKADLLVTSEVTCTMCIAAHKVTQMR